MAAHARGQAQGGGVILTGGVWAGGPPTSCSSFSVISPATMLVFSDHRESMTGFAGSVSALSSCLTPARGW